MNVTRSSLAVEGKGVRAVAENSLTQEHGGAKGERTWSVVMLEQVGKRDGSWS